MSKNTYIYLVSESIPHEGEILLHAASTLDKAVLFLKEAYKKKEATWQDDVFNLGYGQMIVKTIVDGKIAGDDKATQFDGKGNQWEHSPAKGKWIMTQSYEQMPLAKKQ